MQTTLKGERAWRGAAGLAEDVRYYGKWMRDEAEKRIGHLYPKARLSDGSEATVIAWIWARTVRCPNPACGAMMPLTSKFVLSTKKGKEAWVEPSVDNANNPPMICFAVKTGEGIPPKPPKVGRGAKFQCIACGQIAPVDYIKAEGRAGHMDSQLMAIVAEGKNGRIYLPPSEEKGDVAIKADPSWKPQFKLADDKRAIWCPLYGLETFDKLFTPRQLVALTTFSDLVGEARERALADAQAAGLPEGEGIADGGRGARAYADAVATYLAMAVDRQADYSSAICSWHSSGEKMRNTFARQAIPMVWDYAEVNPFSNSSGNFLGGVDWVVDVLQSLFPHADGHAAQYDSTTFISSDISPLISTDPPYYDNIGYADLSDFFYVWLRRSLAQVHPDLFSTLLAPKERELVATPYRFNGSRKEAESFFEDGLGKAFRLMRNICNGDFPLTVYYAYKQQDTRDTGTSSTGWHTLLSGLIESGWEVNATWPMRSERSGRMVSVGTNALASSILLACRPREATASATTRRAFVAALKSELPEALRTLIQGSIAPVDLAQAAIGPGIAVFSRFSRVREADGSDMSVKDALLLINSTLDEVLGEQESDFDPDTRFAVKWYRQYGWGQENSGIADQLARSSDTSIGALERGGIFEAKGGKARLLPPSQLEGAWDAAADERVSVWEATVRLAAVMAKDGADKVAELLPSVQTRVNLDAVKELGFLLFHEAEKKKDTKDAILFNGLVSAWGDVNEQARKYASTPRSSQQEFDFDEDED